ncbi:MAG: helix-turn-helix transcriptional regulator, partial [Bacilli bacterium]|nr:helix-turn-helix transcriptional regulator [Bacilli bacterium]
MKFSEKIQKLRKEYKLSQEQLADQLDVSRQAVS